MFFRELCDSRKVANIDHLFSTIRYIGHKAFGCTFRNLNLIVKTKVAFSNLFLNIKCIEKLKQ